MKTLSSILALVATGILPVVAIAQEAQKTSPVVETPANADGCEFGPEADDSDSGPPSIIQVQLEHIELSHEALTKLLFFADRETADAGPLRRKLQELVESNDAKLLETQVVTSRSTNKSSTSSIHGVVYPTEYLRPSETSKPTQKPDEASDPSFNRPFNPATPTACDVRNVGSSLTVEPTASEDLKYMDVRLECELSWHTGNTIWQEHKDKLGNVSSVKMPNFYEISINSSVTCLNNQYLLLTVQSPKDSNGATDMGRKIVTLLKCSALTVK